MGEISDYHVDRMIAGHWHVSSARTHVKPEQHVNLKFLQPKEENTHGNSKNRPSNVSRTKIKKGRHS